MACAICGVRLHFPVQSASDWTIEATAEALAEMVRKSTARGRDSIGVVYLDEHGEVIREKKVIGDEIELPATLPVGTKTVLVNCRAEPTTEWVKEKTKQDIQPFHHRGVTVAHNGVVANDAEFEKHGTKIDSSVFLSLFEPVEGFSEAVERIQQVTGSYAVAINAHRRLFLFTNYKPLVYRWDNELDCYFFASFNDFLPAKGDWPPNHTDYEVPPYTGVELTSCGPTTRPLPKKPKSNKALVICSGGLDSVTVAAVARKWHDRDVTLLHFEYGCQATTREREAIETVANAMAVPLIHYPLPAYRQHLVGVPLLDEAEFAKGESGAEFAHEWVPARNLVFYALAIALAEAEGFSYIYSGINLEESGAYPDNEEIFARKLAGLIPFSVQNGVDIELVNPVSHLMKHEIVQLGLDSEAPLQHTWSCYAGGKIHCGRCGPCFMRRTAFRMVGTEDVVPFVE